MRYDEWDTDDDFPTTELMRDAQINPHEVIRFVQRYMKENGKTIPTRVQQECLKVHLRAQSEIDRRREIYENKKFS